MDGTNGPRRAVVTEDDHGPILEIAAWFLMVAMIIMIILRMAVRFSTARTIAADDGIAILAMFMGIGSVIAISVAVDDGLGQRDSIRDLSKTSAALRNLYASSILYFLTVWFAKLSTLVLVARLSANRYQLRVIQGIAVVVTLWGLAATFGDAFKCGTPKPWDLVGGQCINIKRFWDGIGAIDILTDVLLIILPFWLFGSLQMKLASKIIVIGAFACRIMVVAATVTRLVYLHELDASMPDFFFNIVDFEICTMCQMALSVMVASAPALKSFVDRTASGMLNVSLSARFGSTYGGESFRMDQTSKSRQSRQISTSSNNATRDSEARHSAMITTISEDYGYDGVSNTPSGHSVVSSDSHRPTEMLERGVIHVDREWTVEQHVDLGHSKLD